MKRLIYSLVFLTTSFLMNAQAPALRDQVLLNGTWTTGGTVPQYSGLTNFGSKTFERLVTVPSGWTGKVIKVEFLSVCFIADVYINGALITTHIGGFTPFTVDITSKVTPGSAFTLKVVVKDSKASPITDASGFYQYPVGGWSNKAGINDDVYLRAYGSVHLTDVFIRPSTRNKNMIVEYTLKNTNASSKTVTLESDAFLRRNGSLAKSFAGPSVALTAGQEKTVRVVYAWTNAEYWFPDSTVLYHFESRVKESGTLMDKETRRFGFREIWTSGNQFYLNGIRTNLYGDYQSVGDTWYAQPSWFEPAANWRATIAKMQAQNIRCMRWHHNPVPKYCYDITDETGLLICDESPNYGRTFLVGCNRTNYVNNFKTWCVDWMKNNRNHASIYMWNATNEMTYSHLGAFTTTECKTMGDAMQKYDSSRCIGYDGDDKVAGALINYHYIEYYDYQPSGSIYSWASKVSATKPTGSGETMHTKTGGTDPVVMDNVEKNKWWLGIWTRGMRYVNFTDVRPACYWFSQTDLASSTLKIRSINMRNAYAPIALFDKAYDDLGIAPFINTQPASYPALTTAANVNRTLVLYNDDYRNEIVEAEVIIKCEGTQYATGKISYQLTLGNHMDIVATYQVPAQNGKLMELVLRTYKNGVKRFEESRFFRITGSSTGTTSDKVTFSPTSNVTQAPPAPAAPTGTTSLCTNPSNTTYTTTGASGATSYAWEISPAGAGSISGTTASAVVDWNNTYTGTATIRVKGSNTYGDSPFSTTLSVSLNPAVTATPATPAGTSPVCQGTASSAINVSAVTNATSYVWSINPSTAGTISGTTVSASVSWNTSFTGSATVSVKGSNGCGQGPASSALSVTVNPKPAVTFNLQTAVCADASPVVLSATPAGGTFSGSGVSGTTFNPATAGAGSKTVTYSVTQNGCSGSSAKTITVNALPKASAGTDVSIEVGKSTQLKGSGGTVYAWAPATGLSNAALSIPVASPSVSTSYTLTVTDSKGCKGTDVVVVTVLKKNDIEENNDKVLVYPNPFNDKLNISSDKDVSAIEMIDGSGVKVLTEVVNSGKNIELNTLSVISGIYFLKIKLNDNSVKIISVMKK